MSKVNISLPPGLDKRIDEIRALWGFASKAEFFRHAAVIYLNEMEKVDSLRKGRFTRVYP